MKTYQLAFRRVVNCDQILNDLIDEIDDCTEESSDDSFDENIPICNTSDDCDSDSDEIRITDPNDIRFHFKSYLFCAAHAGQLTLKDGLKLDEDYTKLTKKISKDIVSKSKVSLLISEEIRKIDKVLKSHVITRWNSILFMVRSVLKLTKEDFDSLRKRMNSKKNKTQKQKETIKNFNLSETEIPMLKELEELLSHFEWMTNEFQSNEVSSSRVYPCIMTLKHRIMYKLEDRIYTQQLRKDLNQSLNRRFNDYIENDCFKLATLLDPTMGI